MNMLVDSNVIIDYVSNRIPEKSARQLDITPKTIFCPFFALLCKVGMKT